MDGVSVFKSSSDAIRRGASLEKRRLALLKFYKLNTSSFSLKRCLISRLIPEKPDRLVPTMRDDQASVGLDDVGFLHLLAVLVNEIMRKGGPYR